MLGLANNIPVAKATLDAHAEVRRRIKEANAAVFEAIKAIAVVYNDPLAENLFDADLDILRAIGNLPKHKVISMLQTGVPIFSLRLNQPGIAKMLESGNAWNEERVFEELLRTFKDNVPLTTL